MKDDRILRYFKLSIIDRNFGSIHLTIEYMKYKIYEMKTRTSRIIRKKKLYTHDQYEMRGFFSDRTYHERCVKLVWFYPLYR